MPASPQSSGAGKPWNIPLPRNPISTGREAIFEQLQAALSSPGTAAALSGPEGIGKTQIAMEYAYRHEQDYTAAVLWATANSHPMLIASFTALASLLNLSEKDAPKQTLIVTAVKRWLAAYSDWLLILDDVNDLALAREFISAGGKGHLLLTTRLQALNGIAQLIEVPAMAPEDGALFLLRRAGIISASDPLDVASISDQEKGRAISEALDGLPLALDQAGAFIAETSVTLADYLSLYQEKEKALRAVHGELAEDYLPVTVTVSLSLVRVAATSNASMELMRLCAFLYPEKIPEEILTEGAAELGELLAAAVSTPSRLTNTLRQANRFSLLYRDSETGTLTLHRRVQDVVKSEMEDNIQCDWAERAVRAVNRAFPDSKPQTWQKCERLLPHALVCAELIQKWEFGFAEAVLLLNRTAVYLCERARYAEAEPLYQRALAILEKEKVLGPEHPNVASISNDLAVLYYTQIRYVEAESFYQRALAIWEKTLGVEDLKVIQSLNSLAELYCVQGRYAEAERLYQRILAIRENALEPEHLEVAKSLDNVAQLYRVQKRYAEAEPFYHRALEIREEALGLEHLEVAKSLDNLAQLYSIQKRYAEAEPFYQRVLAIREEALGLEHLEVAKSLDNLAQLYSIQKRYAEAEPFYQRALAIREKALGPEHLDVAQSFDDLAALCYAQSRYTEAEPLYQRVLAIREKILGPGHPDVAKSLEGLGKSYRALGKYTEAEALLKRSLQINERAFGQDHPSVKRVTDALAELYRALAPPVPDLPPELVQSCATGDCVLYAGAGLSAQAGFPIRAKFAGELLKWATQGEFIESDKSASLRAKLEKRQLDAVVDGIFNTLRGKGKKDLFYEQLEKEFGRSCTDLPYTHQLLKEIPFAAVLTHNFDRLLESTFGNTPVFTYKDDKLLLAALTRSEFFLLKLFGRLDQPDTIKPTFTQFLGEIRYNTWLSRFTKSLFFSRTILFIGASFEDIEAFLNEIQFRGQMSHSHYALVDAYSITWPTQAKELERRYNVKVLPYTPSEGYPEVAQFLEKLVQSVKTTPVKKETDWLKSVTLERIGPFNHLSIELTPNWNILLGDNGVGKSCILKAIAVAFCGEEAKDWAGRLIKSDSSDATITLTTNQGKKYITQLYRKDVGAEIISSPIKLLEAEEWLVLGFPSLRTFTWVHPRQIPQSRPGWPIVEDALPLITDNPDLRMDELKNRIVRLFYQIMTESSAWKNSSNVLLNRYQQQMDELFWIVKQLTPGIRVEFSRVKTDTYEVMVNTDDGEVPIEALSQGTSSLIGWVSFLLERLYDIYGPKNGPTRERYALVLLDEIDAHMHPKWQQLTVSILKEIFPKVQFIATTHSPLIAIGLDSEEIFVVRREGSEVLVERPKFDLRGLRADQILTGPLFNLDTTMDLKLYRDIERYTELTAQEWERLPAVEREELKDLAERLRIRFPTPHERGESRLAFEFIEKALDEQLREIPLEKRKKIINEVKVQVQEDVTGSRRPW